MKIVKKVILIYEDGTTDEIEPGSEKAIKWPTPQPNPFVPAPWTVPNGVPWSPRPDEPGTDGKRTCPSCGLEIGGVMGYVCPQTNCPVFAQITC